MEASKENTRSHEWPEGKNSTRVGFVLKTHVSDKMFSMLMNSSVFWIIPGKGRRG